MAKETYKTIPYEELKQRLNQINNQDHRILLKTIYAGCARVGEIVKHRYKSEWQSFGYGNLEVKEGFLIFQLQTEKTEQIRRVPISRKEDPSQEYFKKSEAWLTEDMIPFYEANKSGWAYSTRWAEKIFQKYFPEFNQHIHYLRHWRATHLRQGLATGKPVPMDIVQKIGGWTNISVPSKFYEHSTIEDYVTIKEVV